jgi:hypothetical protein
MILTLFERKLGYKRDMVFPQKKNLTDTRQEATCKINN